jgi:hypothetical protein
MKATGNNNDTPDCSINSSDCNIQVEQNKSFLVVNADAIVHPGAMVVHHNDASFAARAVVRLRRFHSFAFLALFIQSVLLFFVVFADSK